jgi:peptidyl-dipeptidase A
MKKYLLGATALAFLGGCAYFQSPTPQAAATVATSPDTEAGLQAPDIDDAANFIDKAEADFKDMNEYASHVFWMQANFINHDTNWLAARAGAEATELGVKYANGTKRYKDLPLTGDLERKMKMIKLGLTLPAPSTEGAAKELAEITTSLDSMYSSATIELDGKQVALDDLEVMMGTERDPERLKEIWEKWRMASAPDMHDKYARMVDIANEGARELGFKDVGELWLSGYDMPPAEMAKEVDRLWGQVEPLYDQLHCYVRAKLNAHYGDDVQKATGPIRADLLGNMWAQTWGNVYEYAKPEGAGIDYDLTDLLLKADYTPEKMVRTGEGFYTSLGLEPLPATFWKRSLITKPKDRTVVCHASAWDIDGADDIRIKMCTKVNAEDFNTVHHELGHNFYQRAYKNQPVLYQNGANDGFHEAIGDFIALSITPRYLVQIGLLDESQIPDESKDIGLLMERALDKVAFLPFGLLMDKWRWKVFSGEVAPADYNTAWWELRKQYQGIVPPGDRPDNAFDPGGKYHIPGNTPYLRYFLSFITQFQFQKAACEQAGWTGPLHRCSIYGNKEVGARFNAMMEMGASKPWPDALEAFTGTRQIDGSAIVEYFEPLMVYLKEENKGRSCGW